MKSKENLISQLKALPYFEKATILSLGEKLGLNRATISTYISRFLNSRIKSEEIYRLKNGLYVSTDFYEKNKGDISYSFYLANILRKPSYISSWTALHYYNLLTEATHAITSVGTKVTREYKTRVGAFTYQAIDKKQFSDFSLVSGKFDFYIASPAKALFDLLYFRTRQFRGLSKSDIDNMIKELRIGIDDMSNEERTKFYNMIKKYE